MVLKVLALWFLLSGIMIILYARRELVTSWLEPVLRRPVLIIESDDWGAGPACQSDVLREIACILENFSDSEGRRPVMTLWRSMFSA